MARNNHQQEGQQQWGDSISCGSNCNRGDDIDRGVWVQETNNKETIYSKRVEKKGKTKKQLTEVEAATEAMVKYQFE